jgi:hypothetical protein
MESASGFGAASQEVFMVVGTYHSGPLSAIRYVGVVGLVLFLPLMISLVVRATRLIRANYGTPLFPVALFVGMPMIYLPLPFTLIAGGYDSGLIQCLFSAGLIRLLERASATLPAESRAVRPPGKSVPSTLRNGGQVRRAVPVQPAIR